MIKFKILTAEIVNFRPGIPTLFTSKKSFEIPNKSFSYPQNLQYHSSMLSLHGFHFELKATQEEDDRHLFYLQVG
jgi:hypothetical protein